MNSRIITVLLSGFLFVALLPVTALGRKGELTRPQVALHASLALDQRERIQQTLCRKDCHFISGSWVNSFTLLHYHSETIGLQGFLDELSKCPDVKVSVGFYEPKESSDWALAASNWSLFHMPMDGNTFTVKIRLGSDIEFTKLNIPISGSRIRQPEAEPDGTDQPSTTLEAEPENDGNPRQEPKKRF